MNDEPVRISAWNYTYKSFGDNFECYFDIQFIEVLLGVKDPAATMVLVPMGFDFYNVDIREMTPMEKALWW
jgi:hypothetical protein